jgi:hypothetical protein
MRCIVRWRWSSGLNSNLRCETPNQPSPSSFTFCTTLPSTTKMSPPAGCAVGISRRQGPAPANPSFRVVPCPLPATSNDKNFQATPRRGLSYHYPGKPECTECDHRITMAYAAEPHNADNGAGRFRPDGEGAKTTTYTGYTSPTPSSHQSIAHYSSIGLSPSTISVLAASQLYTSRARPADPRVSCVSVNLLPPPVKRVCELARSIRCSNHSNTAAAPYF